MLGESVIKLEHYEVRILVRKATQNGNAKKVMLGKYIEDSPLSYNARAGKDHTFFEMKDELWREVSQKVNNDHKEIWKINKQFIDEQFKQKKDFFLSHNPENQKGFYFDEIDYLTGTNNLKGKIIRINETLWKIEF